MPLALFETAEKTAEAFSEMSHRAESLGLTVTQLQRLNIVARLTDTDAEAMGKSISRLNRNIAEAASGKNKELAVTFQRLGIHMRDANRHLRSANDLLPELADAFQKTGTIAGKTAGAFALFGRGGIDLIPLMSKGADAVRDKLAEAAKLGFDFEPHAEALERYNEATKKLGISTQALQQEIGAKLAPVLQPIVDRTQAWVDANRDWIATGMADQVGNLADWINKLPMDKIITDFEAAGTRVGDFVHEIGGARTVVEALSAAMALKTVMFLANPIIALGTFGIGLGKAVYGVGTTLVEAWGAVETAAGTAAAAEHAAAAAGAEAAAVSATGIAGLVGLAERIARLAIPVAGGFSAHNADADDHVGRFIDRNLPGAEAVDDWFYRNTAGAVGHPRGWVEKLDSAERGRDMLAGYRLSTHPAQSPGSALPSFLAPIGVDTRPTSSDPFMNSMLNGAPTLAPSPSMPGVAQAPTHVDGGVDINLTINGLPQGASVDTMTSVTGIARTPMVNWDNSTGQAFAGRLGNRK